MAVNIHFELPLLCMAAYVMRSFSCRRMRQVAEGDTVAHKGRRSVVCLLMIFIVFVYVGNAWHVACPDFRTTATSTGTGNS